MQKVLSKAEKNQIYSHTRIYQSLSLTPHFARTRINFLETDTKFHAKVLVACKWSFLRRKLFRNILQNSEIDIHRRINKEIIKSYHLILNFYKNLKKSDYSLDIYWITLDIYWISKNISAVDSDHSF